MPNHNYNFVYEKLVDDENDILGILAYSIYKRQKIEFLKNFHKENNRDPDQDEMASFQKLSVSDSQLEFYKNQSFVLVNAFLDEALEEDLNEREIDFSARVHSEVSQLKGNFLTGVFQSLIGSVLFVFFVGIIVFFSWSLNQGLENAIESIFNIEITHQTETE